MPRHDDTDLTKKRTSRVGRGGIEVPTVGGQPAGSRFTQGAPGTGGQRGIVIPPPVATTPTVTPPVIPPPPIPGAPRRTRSLVGLDSDPTAIRGVQRITGSGSQELVGGVPLFTNITGAGATRGFEAVSPERQTAQDENNALVDRNALLSGRSVLSADGVSTIDPVSAALARRSLAADEAAAREVQDLARTRRDLSLGIRESLARGISPQGLQAATQGLAELQPEAPEAPDLGGLASLLNAQTAQGQLGLGERRLEQEGTQTTEKAQADTEKSVLKIASQIAADPLTGAIDPTKFATALSQVGSLFGLSPTGGIDGGVSPEALANKLRAEGVPEAEIQQHIKNKFGQ